MNHCTSSFEYTLLLQDICNFHRCSITAIGACYILPATLELEARCSISVGRVKLPSHVISNHSKTPNRVQNKPF